MVGRKQDGSHTQEWPGHVDFSLFTLKIRRLVQVCGQSHGAVEENQLFVATGLLAWPWPGITAQDHPSDGSPGAGL